jgi:protease IV
METNPAPPPSFNQPPPLTPPPIIVPPPPPRKRRGWKIFAIVLLVLLVLCGFLLFNFVLGDLALVTGKHARTGGPRLEEIVLEDNDSANKIAVVDVAGLISQSSDGGGYNMVEVIKAQLKQAREDKKIKAVLLKVNSPGGEVLAADDIYRAIADFQKRSGKPVVASMGSLAASGGYYVSAPCRWIVANDLTITGSIGVIMNSWNYRGLMNKVGVRPQVFKSGRFKDMLSGERDLDNLTESEKENLKAEEAMINDLIKQTFEKFKSIVAEGREFANSTNGKNGVRLSPDWEDYADGRVLTGTEAFKLGFVDELGDFEAAAKRARQIAGLGAANLVQFQQRIDFSDLFRLFGKSDVKVMKVDLGLEMPRLEAGHLYFLSPTFLH